MTTDDWLKRLTSDAERISAERETAETDARASAQAREHAQAAKIARNTAARNEAIHMIREAVTRTAGVLAPVKDSTDIQKVYRPKGRLGRFRLIEAWRVVFDWSQLQVQIPSFPRLIHEGPGIVTLGDRDKFPGRVGGWLLPNGSFGEVDVWNQWRPETKDEFAQSALRSRYAISRSETLRGWNYEYNQVVEHVDPDEYEPFARDVTRVVSLGFLEVLTRNRLTL